MNRFGALAQQTAPATAVHLPWIQVRHIFGSIFHIQTCRKRHLTREVTQNTTFHCHVFIEQFPQPHKSHSLTNSRSKKRDSQNWNRRTSQWQLQLFNDNWSADNLSRRIKCSNSRRWKSEWNKLQQVYLTGTVCTGKCTQWRQIESWWGQREKKKQKEKEETKRLKIAAIVKFNNLTNDKCKV